MALGKQLQLASEDIHNIFSEVEGQIAVYYGRIRNGKTYAATADIIQDLLRRGEVVYANWQIDVQDFDERYSFSRVLFKTVFGRPLFFKFKKENFHYFHPDDIDIAFLGRLVNAHVFIDEGQWIFNSHTKDHDPEKRKLIFHNGHYCRSLNIITQRPINIFKDMRSQVHIWYKCEKMMSWPFLIFKRSTIEDMRDDMPDEEQVTKVKVYFARKAILRAYNTHGMRRGDAEYQEPLVEAYRFKFWEKLLLLLAQPFKRRRSDAPRRTMTTTGGSTTVK